MRVLKPCGTIAAYYRGCRCTSCVKAHREYHSAWRSKQPSDKLRASKLKCYHRNKKKYSSKHKAWKEQNKDKLLAYREQNKDKLAAAKLAWKHNNRARFRAYRLARKLKYKNVRGKTSVKQLAARMEFFGNVCAYCGGAFEHIEHGIPLCRGGTNWPANLRPSCADCNAKKGTKTVAEFLALKRQ